MQKIVVAITGASGSIYARLLLEHLAKQGSEAYEVGIVISDNAKEVARFEIGNDTLEKFPFTYYGKNDFMAPFASGSNAYDAMIIIPCSMGTLGRIANGISDDLISRAADVALKERKKLIMVLRDTPYNLVHIRNMEQVTLAGGIICPATPSFYSRPASIDEVALTVVHRVLDLAGINSDGYKWGQ